MELVPERFVTSCKYPVVDKWPKLVHPRTYEFIFSELLFLIIYARGHSLTRLSRIASWVVLVPDRKRDNGGSLGICGCQHVGIP